MSNKQFWIWILYLNLVHVYRYNTNFIRSPYLRENEITIIFVKVHAPIKCATVIFLNAGSNSYLSIETNARWCELIDNTKSNSFQLHIVTTTTKFVMWLKKTVFLQCNSTSRWNCVRVSTRLRDMISHVWRSIYWINCIVSACWYSFDWGEIECVINERDSYFVISVVGAIMHNSTQITVI